MQNTLTLIRGLPGAGKTTAAKKMVDQWLVDYFREPLCPVVIKATVHLFEADDWFYDDEGNYIFDPKDLSKAHQWCQRRTWTALKAGDSVVVSNTFTCRWELEPYLQMAEDHGLKATGTDHVFDPTRDQNGITVGLHDRYGSPRLRVLNVFDGKLSDEQLAARNIHGVPLTAIKRMRDRFEHDWESGHPLPPWERS
jgi:predicted kinase